MAIQQNPEADLIRKLADTFPPVERADYLRGQALYEAINQAIAEYRNHNVWRPATIMMALGQCLTATLYDVPREVALRMVASFAETARGCMENRKD